MPFKSLGAVSYSPSILTMAVSTAILQIFNVKEWPDLEIWVWGPSRSLNKAWFDRPCMTFYQSAIVTIALSCTICELFDVERLNNIVTLKTGLIRGHSRSLKLMPFKSLGVVSYSPSTVTMTVSAVTLEIFSVKEWPDLENRVRVHSRSLEMTPIDRLHMSSYQPSIVTMAVSAAILEIFNVKEWPDLEIWVWDSSRSLKKVRFDRPCMTFYQSAIVTIALSCTICELFDVE